MQRTKLEKRISRHKKVRAKIVGTKERPRVSVYRSNKHIIVQFIDDTINKTILGSKVLEIAKMKGSKSDKSANLGEVLAKKAIEKGITTIVFDRGGFQFHGRIKAIADGLRKGGLKF
jgi:large subunit ribosomal protein L18